MQMAKLCTLNRPLLPIYSLLEFGPLSHKNPLSKLVCGIDQNILPFSFMDYTSITLEAISKCISAVLIRLKAELERLQVFLRHGVGCDFRANTLFSLVFLVSKHSPNLTLHRARMMSSLRGRQEAAAAACT